MQTQRLKPWLAGAILGVAAVVASPAAGQTCTAAATSFAFGTYQPLTGAASTSNATVTIVCVPGAVPALVSYSILLGPGGGSGVGARSMAGPSMRLAYQLYKDGAYLQPWGDGTAGTVVVSDSYTLNLGLPVTRPYTIYGRIPASNPVAIGSYSDLVTILVNF